MQPGAYVHVSTLQPGSYVEKITTNMTGLPIFFSTRTSKALGTP